ncbi:hypothetical protein EVAR_26100_1 [Eumeta japonica]|uniref:Uncharacterized protein n=1 Tax=Eumeta variegata TaxID=151549 RepID=A0A4C1X188_EUMVA|nr:hypothetical protein EVAR_26100_1 [Eumeta japonica]
MTAGLSLLWTHCKRTPLLLSKIFLIEGPGNSGWAVRGAGRSHLTMAVSPLMTSLHQFEGLGSEPSTLVHAVRKLLEAVVTDTIAASVTGSLTYSSMLCKDYKSYSIRSGRAMSWSTRRQQERNDVSSQPFPVSMKRRCHEKPVGSVFCTRKATVISSKTEIIMRCKEYRLRFNFENVKLWLVMRRRQRRQQNWRYCCPSETSLALFVIFFLAIILTSLAPFHVFYARVYARVETECVPSFFTLNDLPINPNLVPAFNSGLVNVTDFDPDHTVDSNYGAISFLTVLIFLCRTCDQKQLKREARFIRENLVWAPPSAPAHGYIPSRCSKLVGTLISS